MTDDPVDRVVRVVATADAGFVSALGFEAAAHIHDGHDIPSANQRLLIFHASTVSYVLVVGRSKQNRRKLAARALRHVEIHGQIDAVTHLDHDTFLNADFVFRSFVRCVRNADAC